MAEATPYAARRAAKAGGVMRPISRRRALQLGGMGLAATVLGGCAPSAPSGPDSTPQPGRP